MDCIFYKEILCEIIDAYFEKLAGDELIAKPASVPVPVQIG